MGMWELLALLSLAGTGWWIWDGISARERAIAVARRACERHEQQLLDETVEQVRVRFVRHRSGSLLPRRTYRFEFTGDGATRHRGELTLHGQRVVEMHLELADHTLIEGAVASSEAPPQ